MFNRLAGARGDSAAPLVSPRGIPDDVAWDALQGNWHLIAYGEDPTLGHTTPGEARRYVEEHGSRYKDTVTRSSVRWYENGVQIVEDNSAFVGLPKYVSDPDFHSHSWLTPDEWEQVVVDFPDEFEYQAMLAAMRELERRDREVRVVFWFDN